MNTQNLKGDTFLLKMDVYVLSITIEVVWYWYKEQL